MLSLSRATLELRGIGRVLDEKCGRFSFESHRDECFFPLFISFEKLAVFRDVQCPHFKFWPPGVLNVKFWRSFLILVTSATDPLETINATHSYKPKNTSTSAHKHIFNEKKSIAWRGIRTHNFPTCIFWSWGITFFTKNCISLIEYLAHVGSSTFGI